MDAVKLLESFRSALKVLVVTQGWRATTPLWRETCQFLQLTTIRWWWHQSALFHVCRHSNPEREGNETRLEQATSADLCANRLLRTAAQKRSHLSSQAASVAGGNAEIGRRLKLKDPGQVLVPGGYAPGLT